jgi:hypothetical protein
VLISILIFVPKGLTGLARLTADRFGAKRT